MRPLSHPLLLVNSLGDRYVKLADDTSKALTIAGEPGAFFVNFIPSCASAHPQYNPPQH
jgi:hypothetical protein